MDALKIWYSNKSYRNAQETIENLFIFLESDEYSIIEFGHSLC